MTLSFTRAKFGDDRLRSSEVVPGQISAFPIDFAGRRYNTLTLPCERVISCLTVDNRACVHARPTCNVDDKSTRVVNFFTVTAVLEPVRTVRWPVSRRTPCTAVSAEAVTAVAMVVSNSIALSLFRI